MRATILALSLILAGAGLTSALAGCGHNNGHGGGGGDGGGGDNGGGDDGGTPNLHPLTVMPSTSTLMITCVQSGAADCAPMMPTVQLSATQDGQSVPAVWNVDKAEIGLVDANGLFTPTGKSGGKVTVFASYGRAGGQATVTVVMSWQQQGGDPDFTNPPANPGDGGFGGVGGDGPAPPASDGQRGVLGGTPAMDTTVRLLYPYEGTVMPRLPLAPVLQWANGPPSNRQKHNFDSVALHIKENNFEYRGYFAKQPSSPWANTTHFDTLPIPEKVWHAAALSNVGEQMLIELTFGEGSQAWGPYPLHLGIAGATLKGTVYYNSYGTAVQVDGHELHNSGDRSCGLSDTNCRRGQNSPNTGPEYGAATLSIKPGATGPGIVAGSDSPGSMSGCRVCHSVAANGSRLITQHGDDYSASSVYDLTAAGAHWNNDPAQPNVAFPALYPDGSFLFSGAGDGGGVNSWSDSASRLYAMPNVMDMTPMTNQLPAGLRAVLPAFSPDGTQLAFNNWSGDQRSLAIMSYDNATKTFGAPQVIFTPASGAVAWPAFTPDGKGVVFEVELTRSEYGFTWQAGDGTQPTGELWYVDIASRQAVALRNLNGVGYIPSGYGNGHNHDEVQNFEPTVTPVVAGGYAWVVFTSRRLYGSIATNAPQASDPREYHWLDPLQTTPKKLWVAALDLNAAPGTDPSHPAFYLPGQEIRAGNSRAFWVLDPCRPDNDPQGCESGDECCGGYCRPSAPDANGKVSYTCSSEKPACAAEYDKCTKDSDCCGFKSGTVRCINQHCGSATPPIP